MLGHAEGAGTAYAPTVAEDLYKACRKAHAKLPRHININISVGPDRQLCFICESNVYVDAGIQDGVAPHLSRRSERSRSRHDDICPRRLLLKPSSRIRDQKRKDACLQRSKDFWRGAESPLESCTDDTTTWEKDIQGCIALQPHGIVPFTCGGVI